MAGLADRPAFMALRQEPKLRLMAHHGRHT